MAHYLLTGNTNEKNVKSVYIPHVLEQYIIYKYIMITMNCLQSNKLWYFVKKFAYLIMLSDWFYYSVYFFLFFFPRNGIFILADFVQLLCQPLCESEMSSE